MAEFQIEGLGGDQDQLLKIIAVVLVVGVLGYSLFSWNSNRPRENYRHRQAKRKSRPRPTPRKRGSETFLRAESDKQRARKWHKMYGF